MVKSLSLDKNGVRKGAWSEEEDDKLRAYIQRYGHWNWGLLPNFAGLSRSGKSCRLRWMNYLRPNMKHGNFTKEEDNIIVALHNKLGNKWSRIAAKLPGRSDNEIKNRWNTHLKKRAHDEHNIVLELEHLESMEPDQANSKEHSYLEREKDGPTINLASESSSSCRLSGSGDVVSSDVASQTSSYQLADDFWNEPFLQDITSSVDSMPSPLYVVDKFTSRSSCQDMTMIDEFPWSMLDSYIENNKYINCWENTW